MKKQYVYVVADSWDYEGCSYPQAVYRRKRDAEKHPFRGDTHVIERLEIIEKAVRTKPSK